jgi:phosphopantetheinyl transferase
MALKCIVLENNPDKEVRHAAVQEAVQKYLGNDAVTVVYNDRGKPSIEGAKKYISVTTTGEKMIVALSDTPVGIDGEYLPRYEGKTDYSMLADRFFSGEESEYVRSGATVADEKERFMKIWTRKEAYVKCTGKGVADFPSFSVVESDKIVSKLGNIPLKKFSINFEGCEDYLFAIAGNLK